MAQADSALSTPRAPEYQKIRDQQLAAAYRRMEDGICNLERMGTIADRLVGEWLDKVTDQRSAELANFAVQHLADMLREFKKDYRAAYAAGRGEVL